jgi:predicted alpha/beta hydrolase
MQKDIIINTNDNNKLAASSFCPNKSNGACILIVPGVGIKQGFYYSFANFLCEMGFTTYTFDYRGIGKSLNGHIKESPATLLNWGENDIESMIQYIKTVHPQEHFHVVAHSGGGVILGLAPSLFLTKSIITVASPRGAHRDYKGLNYWKMGLLSRVLYPLFSHLFGYFPSQLFKIGENVPKNVALQWSHLGTYEEGILGAHPEKKEYYDAIKVPFLALSFDNDFFATPSTVDALFSNYKNASITRKHIRSSDIDNQAVNHFCFFKKQNRATLWELALQFIQQ